MEKAAVLLCSQTQCKIVSVENTCNEMHLFYSRHRLLGLITSILKNTVPLTLNEKVVKYPVGTSKETPNLFVQARLELSLL